MHVISAVCEWLGGHPEGAATGLFCSVLGHEADALNKRGTKKCGFNLKTEGCSFLTFFQPFYYLPTCVLR